MKRKNIFQSLKNPGNRKINLKKNISPIKRIKKTPYDIKIHPPMEKTLKKINQYNKRKSKKY